MSSTTEAPLIPDLEAPPVYTPSTEAVAMSDDKKTLHAQNGPSVTLVVEAGTSKNSVTRAIDVRVINKEKLRKKRQILLKGIGFHMALGLFEIVAAATLLSLAWTRQSPTKPEVNEWNASETATKLGVWSIFYVIQNNINWIWSLRDFIRKQGQYELDPVDEEGAPLSPAKKKKMTRARLAFWCVELLAAYYGGWNWGSSFSTGERLSAPHIWWLAGGLIVVLYPVFLSILIFAVVALISTLVVKIFRLERYVN